MIAALAHPLPPSRAVAWTVAACAAIAAYCLAYTALSGRDETLGEALAWSASMIAPWLVAFELQKRFKDWLARGVVLLGALILSLAVGVGLMGHPLDGFEVVRRLPALGATALVAGLLQFHVVRQQRHSSTVLPLPPRQVDWVRAAGNYVELHGRSGTVTHRATLAATERALNPHGFVRIHRSLLVRRDVIERVRHEDVVLRDGTHLKLGKRFKTRLAA